MKILIIEDDLRNAELIKQGFSEQGLDVQVAYDGQEGKRMALLGLAIYLDTIPLSALKAIPKQVSKNS